ncbi:hypothetical protein Bbelb_110520 [Branchiostoma belcheri]|nr:hypothetical protein Bbelb_110520 [Branchiostoma belcheri]
MPASTPFALCVSFLADILYKVCAGSRDRILDTIGYLDVTRPCQASLVEFFTNVQVQLTRYKLYLYLYYPISPVLDAERLQNLRPCTVTSEWPFTNTIVLDHATGISLDFVDPAECTAIIIQDAVVITATHHLRVTYSVQHRYEGSPSEMMYMLELYRRAMLTRTTILKTHLDGPFGQPLMYMRHDTIPMQTTTNGTDMDFDLTDNGHNGNSDRSPPDNSKVLLCALRPVSSTVPQLQVLLCALSPVSSAIPWLQPLHFVQVPASQKKTSEAAASTLQKRAQTVNAFRDKISGGSGEEQMAAELRRLSKDRLFQVLQEGEFAQIRIPDGHLLGVKTGLNLN